jgi:hypothetical protein
VFLVVVSWLVLAAVGRFPLPSYCKSYDRTFDAQGGGVWGLCRGGLRYEGMALLKLSPRFFWKIFLESSESNAARIA